MLEKEDFNINNEVTKSTISGFWTEKVYIIAADYKIEGYVFMPKTCKKNRILSDILDSKKHFVAIKNAKITDRRYPDRKPELHDFIQINLDSIVLIRPVAAEKEY